MPSNTGSGTGHASECGFWQVHSQEYRLWFSWTQRLGLVVERMEDIILVTGSHLARSWTNVVFPGDQEDAQASFGAKVDQYGSSIHWEFLHEQNRGVVLNFGPAGEV